MRTDKSQKIDPQSPYPCPCRRSGYLQPIALTEAFGCDRCQHIFVLQEDGYVMEQLSTQYPYKRAWRWTGQQWRLDRSALRLSYPSLLVMTAFVVMAFFLILAAFQSPQNARTMTSLLMTLATLAPLGVVFWLASRP
ncbi:MAG: hypothetical protein VKI82_06655 [Leptolyngbya sp.]|nr:hypothetical protein [Leptolyngbya sp.]